MFANYAFCGKTSLRLLIYLINPWHVTRFVVCLIARLFKILISRRIVIFSEEMLSEYQKKFGPGHALIILESGPIPICLHIQGIVSALHCEDYM